MAETNISLNKIIVKGTLKQIENSYYLQKYSYMSSGSIL